jgi:hypothetical protein
MIVLSRRSAPGRRGAYLTGMAGRDRLRGTRIQHAETASSETDCTRDSAVVVPIGIARISEQRNPANEMRFPVSL